MRLHTSHPMMDEGDVTWSWQYCCGGGLFLVAMRGRLDSHSEDLQ